MAHIDVSGEFAACGHQWKTHLHTESSGIILQDYFSIKHDWRAA